MEMNKKEQIILSTLYLLGKVHGRTFLQKFMYLLNVEIFNEKLLDYNFYKYGPFSNELNDTITELEFTNNIKEEAVQTKNLYTAYNYELTNEGYEKAKQIFNEKLTVEEKDKLIRYTIDYRNFTPTQLLKYVYNKYPEVAENSIFEEE